MDHPEELDAGCKPLVTFQEGYRAMFDSKLGAQARLLAAKLPPLATSRFQSLSRLGKVSLTFSVGALIWWLCSSYWSRSTPRKPVLTSTLPPRKRRERTTSTSTWLASEASCSAISKPSYNWAELQKNSVSDQDSVISAQTLVDGTQLAPQQLGLMGMEALETVIGYWEDALAAYNPTSSQLALTTAEEAEFIRKIEEILDAAYSLQDASEILFIHQNSLLNKRKLQHSSLPASGDQYTTVTRTRTKSGSRNSVLSVSTVGEEISFVSAQDTVADLRDFDDLPEFPETEKLELYQAALEFYKTNGIPYRVMRTDFVGCSSDLEYLGKLHCLRMAFTHIMQDEKNRDWWMESGRLVLGQLLLKSDKDPKDFFVAFEDMLEFCKEDGVDKQMEIELSSRNVKCINFYDVCLDYILIDSFEDLESPPSSVLAVMKNRWLSNSFKESALQTAIWSVFQAKRRLLQYPDGFKARFYNVSEILTPTLAWAFFGPDEDLSRLVNDFKEQVLGFLTDIFNFQVADFSSLMSLSDSVMELAHRRLDTVKQRLDCQDLPLS